MPDEVFDSIRLFAAETFGVHAKRITPDTTLAGDLGVDGADGWEFIAAFGARFGVDLSAFQASRHFGPEAGPNPFVWLWWVLTHSRPRLDPITFADLTAFARAGRWAIPDHPSRPAI